MAEVFTNQNIQNIFFDVDGVLIKGFHHNPELRDPWDKNLETDLGVPREDFANRFFYTEEFYQLLTGKLDLEAQVAKVLNDMGLSLPAQVLIDYWHKNNSKVDTEIMAIIAQLKERPDVRLYIATNQTAARAEYIMEKLAFKDYFLDMFHSARIGHTKTSPEFYQAVDAELNLSQYNLPPIFFDDTPNVVATAAEQGWDAYEYETIESLKQAKFFQEAQLQFLD